MSKHVPTYLRIAPDGGLMVDTAAWEASFEHRKQMAETEWLREKIKRQKEKRNERLQGHSIQ